MRCALSVTGLVKAYGQNQVLKGVSFELRYGEVLALLGMNGAGKTTTMECIEGLRRVDGGTIEVDGRLGVQLQSSSIVSECTVDEAVRLFCVWNHAPAEPILSLFGLEALRKKRYVSLSVGQKRKLHLALALVGDPDIVILDEPTAGLDVESRMRLHDEIRMLKEAGKAVLLSSHDMAEVESLCDRLAVLRGGRIAFAGTPHEFKKHVGTQVLITFKLTRALPATKFSTCTLVEADGERCVVRTPNVARALEEIMAVGGRQGIEVLEVNTEQVSLEQRFLEVSKEGGKS
ncbi:ABC transporter ATP-binding protein [Raoultibacter phocaeensis]|uniref:ABC transporter ATP-binding protein n=1 Tax=Raoultibacter phocaeensis TaxID=2479841 RepID=UPI001118E2DD|nr:ABC transporter ATP-binding protein [Raoultibacter phocaeensis]